MKYVYLVLAALLPGNVCLAQDNNGVAPDITKRINALKNRDIKTGTINPGITIDTILKGGPEDSGRFKTADFVAITGYVLGIDDEGSESGDGYRNDTVKNNIRIYIGQSVNSWKDSVFVVEITPKFTATHPNLDTDALLGQKVTVTGYMMYNYDARKFALNTCKRCRATDRKTAWEICPVTDIVALSGLVNK